MTKEINSIDEIADEYDAIVFDQWGVLHNGTKPYRHAVQTVKKLKGAGHCLAVLSNSGKRVEANAQRISSFGFEISSFDALMTGGEAFAIDVLDRNVAEQKFFVIGRSTEDITEFASGLNLQLTTDIKDCEAILLMGLPDGSSITEWESVLSQALKRKITAYCTNLDRKSPRSGGKQVNQPGTLAFDYQKKGGVTVLYGKPYELIFKRLEFILNANRLLLVGDSLETDIAGGFAAGWDTLLVKCGIHAQRFLGNDPKSVLTTLSSELSCPNPTYMIDELR